MASLGPLNAGLAQRTSGPDNETAQFNYGAVNFRNPEFHSQSQTHGGGPCKLQQLQHESATDGIQKQNVEHSSSSAQIPVQLCLGDRIRNQYSIPKKLDDFASHSPVSLVSTHSRTTDQNQLSGRKNFTVILNSLQSTVVLMMRRLLWGVSWGRLIVMVLQKGGLRKGFVAVPVLFQAGRGG
ncbi:hypothetical protein Salat_0207000 [Sesamum alatum]|uniref:Uncharacterized protein n=1 Tax=Sesamum alatum TaxID=300844 RepID=A0AAE2CYG7_9LAMI|nr:hypothetical protein Salat_0207000 [Sesamum alatum]